MIRAVIIEDEINNREYLARLLEQHCSSVEITGMAEDIASGRQLLQEQPFDLAFLDIKMPGGDIFEVLDSLESIDFEIIFITAYDQYAIRAIRRCAIDYLMKPIKAKELVQAVRRVGASLQERRENQRLRQMIANRRAAPVEKRLALPQAEKIDFVPIRTIVRCQGENNYTRIFLEDGKSILIARTLREYEDLLEEFGFARIHQSHLINLRFVRSYLKTGGGAVLLRDGARLSVSRHRREKILERLANL